MPLTLDRLVPLAGVLQDVLAPPVCLACGTPGRDLCGACRQLLPTFAPGSLCPRCALPGSGRTRHGGGGLCPTPGRPCGRRCPARGLAFAEAWALAAHAGPARDLVVALKSRRARVAADVMAAGLAAAPPWVLGPDATLVPVPTHPSRRRARGFDQAVLLAERLARRRGLPVAPLLERVGGAARQVGASRAERLAADRLELRARRKAPPWCVLVDDVHTTGATLHAAALALRDAGADHVTAITYARAL